MKPEAQRIAIAEVCGWLDLEWVGLPKRLIGTTPSAQGARYVDKPVPDYLSDLNAMHEAEKTLKDSEILWHNYKVEIFELLEPRRHYLHATAAQRAEAFLRTLGKWKDDK